MYCKIRVSYRIKVILMTAGLMTALLALASAVWGA
jgi:hypothetical protein